MRIGILGNCQSAGLAASLRAWSPGVETTVRTINDFDFTDPAAVADVVAALAACDRVLVQTMGEVRPALAALAQSTLAATPGRAVRWPVVAFDGLHPDCGYVRRDAGATDGARGPYHSMLACAAWLEGLSPPRAEALFNSFVYAALGYFDAFETAWIALHDRAAPIGYDLEPLIRGPAVFMHTVNHPTIDALMTVAAQALDALGLARIAHPDTPHDALADLPIWPVYPEIARRHRFTAGPVAIDALVAAQYAALDRDRDAHGAFDFAQTSAAVARARDVIRAHVIR